MESSAHFAVLCERVEGEGGGVLVASWPGGVRRGTSRSSVNSQV
jgi:hypothetical protein